MNRPQGVTSILKIAGPIMTALAGFGIISFLVRPGTSPYVGQALRAIIPKRREDITLEDLQTLSRAQLIGVFHQLISPEVGEMKGEYRAALLDSGNRLNRLLSVFSMYFIWGLWMHKAFEPTSQERGHGYNTFLTSLDHDHENPFVSLGAAVGQALRTRTSRTLPRRTARIIRNATHIGPSRFDNRTSFHLVYRAYNGFPVSTMHDEVRKINDTLFLGLGTLSVTGGTWNVFPFVLMGPPDPWVGPDAGYPGEGT
ncbi:MAG: hypothetical protein RRA35_05525 [Desulfomonilia bacterium]|nr:hypothetical protein [Desulfomonilia bacterium]